MVRHKNMLCALKIKYECEFHVGCAFQKGVLPKGLAKELPEIDWVSVKYHIGGMGAQILHHSTDFRIESNGTGPGTWKRVKKQSQQGVPDFSPSAVGSTLQCM